MTISTVYNPPHAKLTWDKKTKAKDKQKLVKQCKMIQKKIELQAAAPVAKQQCVKPCTFHTGTIRTSLPAEQFWEITPFLFVSLLTTFSQPKGSAITDLSVTELRECSKYLFTSIWSCHTPWVMNKSIMVINSFRLHAVSWILPAHLWLSTVIWITGPVVYKSLNKHMSSLRCASFKLTNRMRWILNYDSHFFAFHESWEGNTLSKYTSFTLD